MLVGLLSKSESLQIRIPSLKMGCDRSVSQILVWGNLDVYNDNNPLLYFLAYAKLDVVGQHWVAAFANYNFQLHYKTGKSNVESDTLSHIPWQQARLVCLGLNCLTVNVIMMGCTTEVPLFEVYSGKTVIPPPLYVNTQHFIPW